MTMQDNHVKALLTCWKLSRGKEKSEAMQKLIITLVDDNFFSKELGQREEALLPLLLEQMGPTSNFELLVRGTIRAEGESYHTHRFPVCAFGNRDAETDACGSTGISFLDFKWRDCQYAWINEGQLKMKSQKCPSMVVVYGGYKTFACFADGAMEDLSWDKKDQAIDKAEELVFGFRPAYNPEEEEGNIYSCRFLDCFVLGLHEIKGDVRTMFENAKQLGLDIVEHVHSSPSLHGFEETMQKLSAEFEDFHKRLNNHARGISCDFPPGHDPCKE